ncbi:MAG: MATE family efflux transporter [Spirochaetales bacterium]|nr:MATE family efflux transporter [Spirochaetales bacterium]
METIKNQNISIKRIITITLPVVLSSLALNVMVFVDRAFIAKASLTQFSATMPASFFANTIASIFLGMVGYASTLISQYYGAGKNKECSSSMWQAVYLSTIFSVILLALSPLMSFGFQIMGHKGELLGYEKQYFYFIIIASCVQLFSTAFSSFYTGRGNTRTIMIVGITGNICNIILDWIFIFGKFGFPAMGGIAGGGLATIVSCLIGVIIYIFLLNRKTLKDQYDILGNRKPDKNLIMKFLKFGFPTGIQSFVSMGYVSFLLLIIGKTGEFNLACSNIAFTIEGISIFPVWGIGAAAGIVAGQERGAGRVENIFTVLKRGIFLGLCFNVLIILVYNLFPEFLISIFNNGKEPDKFERIMAFTIPLIRITSVWLVFDTMQIIIGNVLRYVGDTFFMMMIHLTMPFLFYIVIPYISVWSGLSLFWIWIELLIFTLCMLTLLSIRFLGGKWKKINMISATSAQPA